MILYRKNWNSIDYKHFLQFLYSLEDKKDPTIPLDYNGKQITVKVNYVLVKDYYLCMLSKQRAFNWSNIEKKANE